MATLFFVALTATTIAHAVNVYDLAMDEWNLYKTTLRKHFRSSSEEYVRLQHFLESKQLVARHNERYAKGLESYRLTLNQFADKDPFEHVDPETAALRYMEERGQVRRDAPSSKITIPPNFVIPDSVDWRNGAVSLEAIDQDDCGSCYAISSAAVMDALMYLKYGKKTHLSAQQIVDCSTSFGNNGCDGGTFSSTFLYLTTTGLLPFDEYPYENKFNEKCKINNNNDFSDTVKEFYYMYDGNQDKLKYALATYGPMAVGIDARSRKFHFYGGGIYDDPTCGWILVHAVLLVGYGTDPETKQDYWIIKNSWGPQWGENGFIRMAINNHSCGIGTLAYAASIN